MSLIVTAHCKKCTYSQPAPRVHHARYLLSDGDQFPLQSRSQWCDVCERLAPAEDLCPSHWQDKLQDLGDRLASVRQTRSWLRTRLIFDAKLFSDKYPAEATPEILRSWAVEIDEANRALAFLRTRTALARCLHCGTPAGARSDEHGGCGGEFEYQVAGHFHGVKYVSAYGETGEYLGEIYRGELVRVPERPC